MVIGWLKPAVILPAGLITGLSGEQLEAILAHELIHIRRHDYLVNLLQNVVETIFFYHPAVAWVSGRIRVEREHRCDDAALVACGGVLDYARALAALAELRRRPALGVAATDGSLVERIRRLGNAAEMSARRGISPVFPTLALLFAAICALAAIAHAAMAQHPGDLTTPSASAKGGAIKDLPSKEQAGDAVTIRGRVLRPDGEPAVGAQILRCGRFGPAGSVGGQWQLYWQGRRVNSRFGFLHGGTMGSAAHSLGSQPGRTASASSGRADRRSSPGRNRVRRSFCGSFPNLRFMVGWSTWKVGR